MTDKPLSVREARAALEAADEDRRQAVVQELEALSSSEITDVLSWDEMGRVQVRASDQLSARARRAIKKVKITPSEEGNTIEVEMHDKLSALRLLAKHRGLLEPNSDDRRPSMIGINVKGPDTTTYEIIDEDFQEKE
jgi:acetyl-CoA acetyltransferase